LFNLLTATGTALAATGVAIVVAGSASSAVDHEACRPDGLYKTPGVTTPYCAAYDSNGRELLGTGHGRRVIGYFTGWRTGKDGTPSYLASNIPWTKVTHINYAFAHVDGANKISIGTPTACQQRRDQHDLARGVRRRDGPGLFVHWPLQPAQQVQEAKSEREDSDQRRWMGGDRRLLRRRGRAPGLGRLLPHDHDVVEHGEHQRHQHIR
jgi:hypothetical protein